LLIAGGAVLFHQEGIGIEVRQRKKFCNLAGGTTTVNRPTGPPTVKPARNRRHALWKRFAGIADKSLLPTRSLAIKNAVEKTVARGCENANGRRKSWPVIHRSNQSAAQKAWQDRCNRGLPDDNMSILKNDSFPAVFLQVSMKAFEAPRFPGLDLQGKNLALTCCKVVDFGQV